MMRIRIDNVGSTKAYVENMANQSDAVQQAARQAGDETAQEIQSLGRDDIANAGRFGPYWTNAFVSVAEDAADGVVVTTTMSARGWRMFQEGRVVQGRPLIWIPFSDQDAVGIRFDSYPGELVRVDSRAGLPLLISTSDHRPKYFGKESITIPKKWHLEEIAEAVGSKIGERFVAAYKGITNG